MTSIIVDKPYLFIAFALTVALFVLGGQSWSAEIGIEIPLWHWIAHLASFAIIAISYAWALPRSRLLVIACLAATIGIVHELYQVLTPAHDAELNDVLLNIAGAIFGALSARILFPLLHRMVRAG